MSSSGPPRPAAITIRSRACLVDRMFLPIVGYGLLAALSWGQVSVIAYCAIVAAGGILLLYRACRHRVRFDDRGIMVRNFYWTHKLSWHDVSHFGYGKIIGLTERGPDFWAVRIVLNNGPSVAAEGTARVRESDFLRVLATMGQVAARWQIPAQVTGEVPGRPAEG
jgi:hypothetical protein